MSNSLQTAQSPEKEARLLVQTFVLWSLAIIAARENSPARQKKWLWKAYGHKGNLRAHVAKAGPNQILNILLEVTEGTITLLKLDCKRDSSGRFPSIQRFFFNLSLLRGRLKHRLGYFRLKAFFRRSITQLGS